MRIITTLLITLLLLPIILSGQSKFDFGIFLGYAEHGGDVHSWGRHGVMVTENAHFAYGINGKYNINENFGLRLNYWASQISGQDVNIDNEFSVGHQNRGYTFESNLSELSLVAEYEILGHNRWKKSIDHQQLTNENPTAIRNYKRTISPYVFGGLGVSFSDPQVEFNSSVTPRIARDIENTANSYFQIPIGLGIRFDASENIYIGLEASSRVPLNDYLDGISESANPDKNDSYQFIGATVGLRIFTGIDSDGDGIKDEVDACPDIPGIKIHNGCNDSDNDGILDHDDACPQLTGLSKFNGCPDKDGDGIIDPEDKCPEIPGITEFLGCKDTDGDGIGDHLDECPNEVGPQDNNGCPSLDKDQDGVPNTEDDCPDVAGTLKGCPDSDKDGLPDKDDPCPSISGSLNGCPDTDGDGLADNLDKCPNKKGDIANSGCPKPAPSDSEIINSFYINDIYFQLNKADQSPEYYRRIDQIKVFSQRYPNAYFTITGHTDNQDSEEYNIKLSERRAQNVFDSLVKAGVAPSRMTKLGMGEKQPKATNDTEEGRALNRRVEVRASKR